MTKEDPATEVHLWWCSLDLPPTSVAEAYAVLAGDEIDRARRYKFTRDRLRFVAARSFLRRTLAEYLSLSPLDLSFVYGTFGKPLLAPISLEAGSMTAPQASRALSRETYDDGNNTTG